ncbi:hypothetical protein OPQ81_001070 [Rhizoctonia solani]|nr:hypothetical protein OPQ81_001070 [Rhizoctonia solani]
MGRISYSTNSCQTSVISAPRANLAGDTYVEVVAAAATPFVHRKTFEYKYLGKGKCNTVVQKALATLTPEQWI